ncbi:MAG: hypothetical protein GY820_05775 [Gammaproteobacteria bacterium]|nr:hypothetical protein [Gammaproteobacteria bacterium]
MDTIAEEKRACIGRLASWACRLGVLGRAGEGRADALKRAEERRVGKARGSRRPPYH